MNKIVVPTSGPPNYTQEYSPDIAADALGEWQRRRDQRVMRGRDDYLRLRNNEGLKLLWTVGYGGPDHAERIARPAIAKLLQEAAAADTRHAAELATLLSPQPSEGPVPF